ncbi:MAG: hypothetical protein TYPL_1070 [Candidatus Tyloplasma litorale]|nr:MAG: hypothetical protein TYPL_1070 [Mycoplasmatales bacterium]
MILVLVGSPLSGKTTILKKLNEKNIKVFSADVFVNNIYKKGELGYEIIRKELGNDFVGESKVNKRKLAEWCSENSDNINKLNSLIHPLIYNYLEDKDNYVAELPIVSNSHIKFKYDKLVYVKASDEVIRNRFISKKIENPIFINKIINDWKKIDIKFDLVIDTTENITNNDIDKILSLLNNE